MITITDAEPGSAEWLDARREGIGGSDIGAVLEVSPWTTPRQVWQAKFGVDTFTGNTRTRIGQLSEPMIATLYAEDTGVRLARWPDIPSIVAWDGDPIVRSSLDAALIQADGSYVPVEFKTAKGVWDEIPPTYWAQGQWQAGICGADRVQFAVLHWGQDFRIYEAPFDPEWFERATTEARDWWNQHVLLGVEPEPTGTDRGDPVTPVSGKAAPVDGFRWDEYMKARAARVEAEALEELALASVQRQVGDGEIVTVDGEPVASWKAQTSRRLDTKRLRVELPEVAAEYERVVESRVWRVS